jgi:hypothetical protein
MQCKPQCKLMCLLTIYLISPYRIADRVCHGSELTEDWPSDSLLLSMQCVRAVLMKMLTECSKTAFRFHLWRLQTPLSYIYGSNVRLSRFRNRTIHSKSTTSPQQIERVEFELYWHRRKLRGAGWAVAPPPNNWVGWASLFFCPPPIF